MGNEAQRPLRASIRANLNAYASQAFADWEACTEMPRNDVMALIECYDYVRKFGVGSANKNPFEDPEEAQEEREVISVVVEEED